VERQRLVGAVITGYAIAAFSWPATGGAIDLTLAGRPVTVNGYLMVRQVIAANQSTPDELTLEQLWMETRYQWSDALAFDFTLDVQHGGPATEETRGGMYNYRSVFQSVSPSVQFEEAYIDASFDALDVRAGMLKFAWGKLDRIQPVDVLNVERYSDPFLLDEDERKIGVPALEGSYYLPAGDWVPEEARLTAVWIPQYFPYRFPLVGERWFPPASVPPSTFDVPQIMQSIPIGFRTENTSPPSFQMDNCGYAGRASAFTAGVDYALYYYHGFDRQPAFRLVAEASGEPLPVPPFVENVSAQTRLQPVFRTIDLWGADAAYAWGSFTLRFEAAYVSGRPFARDIRFLVSDPRQLAPEIERALRLIAQGVSPVPIALPQSFAVRNAVEWGIGVDYTWNDFLLLLQINQTDILHNDVDLLIRNVDTVLSANLRRAFFHDDLTLQLIGVQGFESGYTLLLPRITYRFWDHFEARAGYLFIAGSEATVVGQYKENDEGFIWLRYLL
jgi:hypothetical protein